ncbi:MAG: pyruvate, phosphate dikinase [Pelagibacterales bacterium]|nr:pyruvate, phosphate dikinase [Pelagibacterales bacterium]
MDKWVYTFGAGKAQGNAKQKELLGGKGANLAEMSNIGLPVPPGFTITTEVCNYYYRNNKNYPTDLEEQLITALDNIEKITKMKFGSSNLPLLLSVRSGARASMPGMMDTVLNLGLNDKTVIGLSNESGDKRFAYDSYRRFIQMYGDVVLGIDSADFEEIIEQEKLSNGVVLDTEVSAEIWENITILFKDLVKKVTGDDFPQDPIEQLWGAISAVFSSWMNQRAITYRKLNDIPASWGTAVNIQAMVFGNMGDDCCTGVAFTRNPSSGENNYYGEYLVNAQGEDVVAGIRTPQNLTIKEKELQNSDTMSMEEAIPEVFKQLTNIFDLLEKHYKDMQDIEFTVQKDVLWILQTRSGKRTSAAAVKIAVDMYNEKLISKEEAVVRIDPLGLDQLLHPTLDPNSEKNIVTTGLPASPGAAFGKVVFNSDTAEELANNGESVILVRMETSPEDIHGMYAAKGILTSRGGMTSHAAVVARGMGRACVAGAGDIIINSENNEFISNNIKVKEGDIITIDGSSGEVILGEVSTILPELSEEFNQLMKWADEIRDLKIRTNAETPKDVKVALEFGAEGIGLCRTEHMFFDTERISAVREMIFSDNEKDRRAALNKIAPMQKNDFTEIFILMKDLPVTIRLLDPPLHEFLPREEVELDDLSKKLGKDKSLIKSRVLQLEEQNPMLGHRGCRLGITFPEIYEMQVRSIFESVTEVSKKLNLSIMPEIMVPLIISDSELIFIKEKIDDVALAVEKETGVKIKYLVGTMVELPRAALNAEDISKYADFFSFGTNDLTQTALGISRDDSGKFLPEYIDQNLLESDPFVSIDVNGVGKLVSIAVDSGKKQNKNLKLGICGEHGGDPKSIEFFHKVGLDYVSCSPFRVPIARLAAAQSKIRNK